MDRLAQVKVKQSLWCFIYLGKEHKILTCGPNNLVVTQLASCLIGLINELSQRDSYRLGEIVLFGNRDRMPVTIIKDLSKVYLGHCCSVLLENFNSDGMKEFLESAWSGCYWLQWCHTEYPGQLEMEELNINKKEQYFLTFNQFISSTSKDGVEKLISLFDKFCDYLPPCKYRDTVMSAQKFLISIFW